MSIVYIKHISITTRLLKTPICYRISNSSNTIHLFPGKPLLPKNQRIFSPLTMAENIRTRASRTGDGGTRAVSPQVCTDGLTSFSVNELEPILNNLSKWIAVGLLTLILLLRHDAEALWVATGSVLNNCIAIILKKTLNQDRPLAHLRSDPGMPSSHAQNLSYIVTFSVLSLVQWLGFNGLATFLGGLSIMATSYLVSLRVTQGLHTVAQVLVGAILGTTFSLLWFWSWEAIVLKAFLTDMGVRFFVIIGGVTYFVSFILHVIRYLLGNQASERDMN